MCPTPITATIPSEKSEPLDDHSPPLDDLLLMVCRLAGHGVQEATIPNLMDGRVVSDLLHRIDRNFFKANLIPSHGNNNNGMLRAAQLKRMYLRIISYGREHLNLDWSEFPVPDFNSLTQTMIGPIQVTAMSIFASILLFVTFQIEHLRVEVECLLAGVCKRNQLEIKKLLESCKSVAIEKRDKGIQMESTESMTSSNPAIIEMNSPKSPTLTDIAISPLDYEGEYKALQVLFEAISVEAETLREQLIATSQFKELHEASINSLQSTIGQVRRENQSILESRDKIQADIDQMVLEKANLIAQFAKDSGTVTFLLDNFRQRGLSVTSINDINKIVNDLIEESSSKDATIQTLQLRCEEAEISRDVLMEKEKILLDDRREGELVLQAALTGEQNRTAELEAELDTLQTELQQSVIDIEQLRVRMAQKEDEVMQLANERTELCTMNAGLQDQLEKQQQSAIANVIQSKPTGQNLQGVITTKKFQIKKLKAKVAKLKLCNQELREMAQKTNIHRSKLRKRLRRLWPKFHSQRVQLEESFAKIKELEVEANSHTLNMKQVEQILESNMEEINMLQTQLSEQCEKNATISKDLKKMDNLLGREPHQNGILSKPAETIKEIESLCVELAKTKQELNISNEQIIQLRHRNETLQQQIVENDKLERKVSSLKLELEKTLDALDKKSQEGTQERMKNATLEQELASARNLYEILKNSQESQLAVLREASVMETDYLKTTLKEYQGRLREAEQVLREKSEECHNYKRQLEELNNQNEEFQAKLLELERSMQRISNENLQLSNDSKSFASIERELKGLIAGLEDENLGYKSTLLELNQELEGVKRDSELMLQGRKKVEDALESVMIGKENVENEMHKLMKESSSQSTLINELCSELQLLRQQLDKVNNGQILQEKSEELVERQRQYERENFEKKEEEYKSIMFHKDERITELESHLGQLFDQVTIKEEEWKRERAELVEWLRNQEKELECLSQQTNKVCVEISCQTIDPELISTCIETFNEQPVSIIAPSPPDPDHSGNRRLKTEMTKALKSIREEHKTILSVWHNLGSRMYRDTLFRRVQ